MSRFLLGRKETKEAKGRNTNEKWKMDW